MPESIIAKTYGNLTQIWGTKMSGRIARMSFVVDQSEQYLYMIEIQTEDLFKLFLINWDSGAVSHVLQTTEISSRFGWNSIILSESSSKYKILR